MFKSEILTKKEIAKNVIKLRFEKPKNFNYTPNQIITIGADENNRGMFSLISRPDEDFLEVIIKIYPEHHGVTEKISFLDEGDKIILGNPFGGMKDEEDILFIAGGSGITPFISHLRNFKNTKNYCLASFMSKEDVIEEEFLRDNSTCSIFISQEETEDSKKYNYGYINKKAIEDVLKIKKFEKAYVCGPPKFEDVMIQILNELNIKGLKIY
jgi:NAD(P)H-flavin reductase